MKILKNGTIIQVSRDSILIQGLSKSKKMGLWVLKRKQRIYDLEPILRYKVYTKDELIKAATSI